MNASVLTSRAKLASRSGLAFNGDRDLYAAMGYPRALTVQDFFAAYLRQDIAGRIVDAYPDATWREAPSFNGEGSKLDKAVQELDNRFGFWRTLHRLDRLVGIGHYGVLLLGLDGGEPMQEPVKRGVDYRLMYLQPHSERTAQIARWNDDPTSPRYGKPELYRITTGTNWTGVGGGSQKTIIVHHSRVIHVAERALEDESIGTPRLERIWNRLMDVDKLLGGSAEIYWQNAAMIMQLDADRDVDWDPEEQAALAAQVEEMQHSLRRWLRTRGVTANNIAPGLQGSDPTGAIDKQVDFIAGATGIPKRILLGSEAGELASSQDENNWSGRVQERREQFAGPSIAEPTVRRLQLLNILPGDGCTTEWPESDNLGEQVRADIALKKAQAVATYANAPGAELVVSPDEFRFYLGETSPLPIIEEDEILEEGAGL